MPNTNIRTTNPIGKGRFKKGRSGNPAGRAPKQIGDLNAEARKYAGLALDTIVKICAEAHMDRDRLAAARELLDRGFGRAVQRYRLDYAGQEAERTSPPTSWSRSTRLMSWGAVEVEQPAEKQRAEKAIR